MVRPESRGHRRDERDTIASHTLDDDGGAGIQKVDITDGLAVGTKRQIDAERTETREEERAEDDARPEALRSLGRGCRALGLSVAGRHVWTCLTALTHRVRLIFDAPRNVSPPMTQFARLPRSGHRCVSER